MGGKLAARDLILHKFTILVTIKGKENIQQRYDEVYLEGGLYVRL